jgi:competence protein ComEC
METGNHYHRPMVPLTLAMALGIGAGSSMKGVHHVALLVTALSLGGLLFSLALRKNPRIWPMLLMGCLGALSMHPWSGQPLPENHIARFDGTSKCAIAGRVLTAPLRRGYRHSFTLAVERTGNGTNSRPATGTLRVTASGGSPAIMPGDRIRFMGRIRLIRSFHNPGGFDYQRYMGYKGILATTWTRTATIQLLERGRRTRMTTWLSHCRKGAARQIHAQATEQSGQVLKALLLGDRSGITRDLRAVFNRTGCGHLLAISGLHIGIVAGAAFFLCKHLLLQMPFFLWRGWGTRAAALLALLPVWFYGLLAGPAPSTLRALVMVSLFLAAVIAGRRIEAFNTLALAACVLLLLDPTVLFSISFQLSFAAVLAILAGLATRGKPDPVLFPRPSPLMRRIAMYTLVSLSAYTGTLPLCMHYFHLISLVSLPVNLLLVPIIAMGVVPLGLFSLFCGLLLPGAGAIGLWLAATLLDQAIGLLSLVAVFPLAAIRTFAPTPLEIGLFWLFGGSVVMWRHYRIAQTGETVENHILFFRRRATVASLVAAVAIVAGILDATYWLWRRYGQHHLQVTIVDVGQGSAALLELPGGRTVLIDGGGFSDNAVFDVGHRILSPFLRQKKIGAIDLMVLSHPNSDHLNGLIYLLRHFTVRSLWTNGCTANTRGYQRFMEAVECRRIPHLTPGSIPGEKSINGVRLVPLFPGGHLPLIGCGGDNDASLVLKIQHGRITFLFPGDIEAAAEKHLVERYGTLLKSTILAAPHHGSGTSSTPAFLERVSPRCVAISAGYRNRYHAPHASVLARYRALGARIYRTDLQGAVIFRSDGWRYRAAVTHAGKSLPN